MSFTKSELISSIKDYTENTETSFVANIPTFIRLAEERILKVHNLIYLEKMLLLMLPLAINIMQYHQIF